MVAVLYIILYLLCGAAIVQFLLPAHKPLTRWWLGLSLGLFLFMWLPALMAFAFKFSKTAHYLALILLAILTAGAYFTRDKKHALKKWDQEETTFLIILVTIALPLTIFGGYLQYTHNLRPAADGSYHVGQSTYGDLPLHTAIITSMRDASFPPDYSILPGELLSYPFLMDSLSTTLYMFGFSLQLSMIVPGTLMMALCFAGYLLLAREMAGSKRAVVLAALLFFLNGGLGFLYTFDRAAGDVTERLHEVMDGYYKTPTNQPDPYNLRWSNVIADLMIPQRTILGGWTMVLPCIYLLFTAFAPWRPESRGNIRQILLLGIWAGGLPLIHTHSFLALGLISVGFLLYTFVHLTRYEWWKWQRFLPWLLLAGIATTVLALLQSYPFLAMVILSGGYLFYTLVHVPKHEWKQRLPSWLLFGGVTIALALPQLITWTFTQASGSSHFLRFQFNWVNNPDGQGLIDFYLWFYIKNIGLPVILLLCALTEKNARHRFLAAGAFMIFIAAEFIRFQPNEYDNNKLFYVWYMIGAILAADYAVMLFDKLRGLRGRYVLAGFAAVVFFLSAGLTLAREAVSDYQSFSKEDIAAAAYIEQETPAHAVFLTGFEQHLNPVSSLAGRTIICGPNLWLYYHGFDTTQRNRDIARFYTDPQSNLDVLLKYQVEYILLSSHERSSEYFDVNYAGIEMLFPLSYTSDNGEISIYMVPEKYRDKK